MPKNIIPDSETRATAEHAKDLRLWLRMLACTNLIENHVRARLRSDFDITLPRFDLMSQLERSPQGLKPTAEGRKSFRRMAEAHEGWMVALFSGMEERQRDQLYDLLASLKTSAAKIAAKH